jgi:hypothetical protein
VIDNYMSPSLRTWLQLRQPGSLTGCVVAELELLRLPSFDLTAYLDAASITDAVDAERVAAGIPSLFAGDVP